MSVLAPGLRKAVEILKGMERGAETLRQSIDAECYGWAREELESELRRETEANRPTMGATANSDGDSDGA